MIDVLLAQEKDIIGGWVMLRSEEIPNVYKWKDENKVEHIPVYPKGLTEVDRMGGGCVLVKREVYEKLPKPCYKYDEKHKTEDLYFCDLAKEKGYEIWVEGTIRCQHIDITYR
jgi:hypothetical protein